MGGCVSKGKYISALQQKALAESELGISKIDLGDARAGLVSQEALIAALRAEIGRLDNSVTTISSQNKNDQVQLGASLNKTQQLLNDNLAQLETAERQLQLLANYYSRKEARLQEVMSRLGSSLAGLPKAQANTKRSREAVLLHFGEGLFFIRNGSKLSEHGSMLVQKLAMALSDQADILVDVVAYPAVSAGTMKSWESASERANTLGYELVARYGLSPKQVSATGKQGEIIIIDGAPAESKQRKTVEILIRLDPVRYPLPTIID